MKNKKTKEKGIGLWTTLLMYALLPLSIAIIVFTIYSVKSQSKELKESTYERLKACAVQTKEYFEWDIRENILECDEISEQFIDSLKDQHIELTLFQKNTRWLTSVKKDNGERNNGTTCDAEIWSTVKTGKDYKADKVSINNEDYYVFYTPVYDKNNNVWGMAFAGEKKSIIENTIKKMIRNSLLIALVLFISITGIAIAIGRLIIKPLKDAEYGLTNLASGDVSSEFNTKTHIKELKAIKNSIISVQSTLDNMVTKIKDEVSNLNINVNTVSEAVAICNSVKDGITQAVEDMAHGSNEMAESVQNTASVMTDMGNEIDSISDLIGLANEGAIEISKISDVAKNNLEELISANKDTVDAANDIAKGIEESSTEVEEIRKAAEDITGIASQTNLLSLNASIEAARAGEAGRGFAVVASEIQQLSDQSNKAAQKIQEILGNITTSSNKNNLSAKKIKESVSNEGKVLIDVNNSFNSVSEKINQMTEQMSNIANNTNELTKNKNKILDEISTLSSISEENAAATEETSASTEELGANIENIHTQTGDIVNSSKSIQELVEFFK